MADRSPLAAACLGHVAATHPGHLTGLLPRRTDLADDCAPARPDRSAHLSTGPRHAAQPRAAHGGHHMTRPHWLWRATNVLCCGVAALLVLCAASAAQASTYYLSPSGNDSASGTAESTPWK